MARLPPGKGEIVNISTKTIAELVREAKYIDDPFRGDSDFYCPECDLIIESKKGKESVFCWKCGMQFNP